MFGLEGYTEDADDTAAIEDAMRAALLSEELDLDLQNENNTKHAASLKESTTLEVVEFYDAFKEFGKPIQSLELCLQYAPSFITNIRAAIDGGAVPKKINLAGNKVPELKYSRIDDTFSDTIFKSLANVTFLNELDLSFNVSHLKKTNG
jgi:hypothetical protein